MFPQLTELEDAVLGVVRARSGLPASAIAKQLGRDRNQIRRLLLRLTDRGHVIAEEETGGEGGGRIAFYTPDSPRNPLPDVRETKSREHPSGGRRTSPVVSPSSRNPIEGKFRIVDEPEPVRSTIGLPVPYAAAGVVVHQLAHKEIRGQAKCRLNPPADRRAFRPPSPMMQQIAMLSQFDPEGSATAALIQRQRIEAVEAAEYERQREFARREAIAEAAAPTPPTLAEAAARFATCMTRARAAGSRRPSHSEGKLADMSNQTDGVAEVRRVAAYRHDKSGPEPEPKPQKVATTLPPRSPPWRRPAQPPKPSILKRLFGSPRQSSEPVWK